MLGLPLLVYALYCAYRDRREIRARRHGNPYSYANLLERHWREVQKANALSQAQRGWITRESAMKALRRDA